MANRLSSVPVRRKTKVAQLREDLLTICENNHCRAMVLGQLIYWNDINAGKMKNAAGDSKEHLWIRRTQEELAEDILRAYSADLIAQALKWLIGQGMLESRRHPTQKWNRTLQYRVQVELVNDLIDSHLNDQNAVHEHREDGCSKTENSGLSRPENQGAILETMKKPIVETNGVASMPHQNISEGMTVVGKNSAEILRSPGNRQQTPGNTNSGRDPSQSSKFDWPEESKIRFIDYVVQNYPKTKSGHVAVHDEVNELAETLKSRREVEGFAKAVKNLKEAIRTGSWGGDYVYAFRRFAGLGPRYSGSGEWKRWEVLEPTVRKRELVV